MKQVCDTKTMICYPCIFIVPAILVILPTYGLYCLLRPLGLRIEYFEELYNRLAKTEDKEEK